MGSYVCRVPALAKLNTMIRKLPVVFDVPALLGHEGAATAQYWPALAAMVQPDWALAGRTGFVRRRRPANDAFNVVAELPRGAARARPVRARPAPRPAPGLRRAPLRGRRRARARLRPDGGVPRAAGGGPRRLPVQQPHPAPGDVRQTRGGDHPDGPRGARAADPRLRDLAEPGGEEPEERQAGAVAAADRGAGGGLRPALPRRRAVPGLTSWTTEAEPGEPSPWRGWKC